MDEELDGSQFGPDVRTTEIPHFRRGRVDCYSAIIINTPISPICRSSRVPVASIFNRPGNVRANIAPIVAGDKSR